MAGRAIAPAEFAEAMALLAPIVDMHEERTGDGITYFELTAALAFAWFAERTVDVGVIETGLGGDGRHQRRHFRGAVDQHRPGAHGVPR